MEKQKRRIVGGFLVLVMCAGMSLNAGAVTIDEAEKKADQLEQQKESAEAEKQKLTTRLNGIIDDMNETQEKLTAKEEEIDAAEQELVQAKIDENNQYESMKKRIKFMYEGGNTQLLEVLVKSESIGDLLNKAEYVSQLSLYDRDMLTEFQNTVKEVEEKEAALKTEYEELNELQDQLSEQQTEVQELIDSKEAQISDIQDEIKANAETLDRLKKEAEEAKRLREEQAAAAAAAAASSGGGSSYTAASSGNVVSGSGYFTHPCPGMTYQSSYFGEIREFEVGGHKGNDYAAPAGTPTYAAAAGTVVIAGWSNSAGNWVVINHGNGLVTKYMHHSSLCVSAGQYVEKGQQIGYVGSTGQSTGPHLHFQVELNGVAVSPDSYM
ncbi:peptidoglycan DD-metalloendopeptidase family protein [Mediterraneibacter glycyrrhizinilyticus]|uniref:murein hydrolase activator EnvC family protein n=1 Tax=Mediterraneibacter glycyrrhizinilyticus TaxID=342942 RepID=UPI00195F9CCC|nr:M23 family metallopeptidase [Mediterraneibacter glycyrrhizinilyticus]MBM6750881.1 peptidoglycan DD-metalloendopeptidase family protein [Mediterraneibacter glycyrrhizinilyticus]